MSRSPLRILFPLLFVLLLPAEGLAWGKTGHRVTGGLAERWLSPQARAAVQSILGRETLAEASTWADEMRSSPETFWQETASPWHYVTVPPGRNYAEVGAPPEGDAYSALQRFAADLRDPDATREERALALRFAVHLIGDLHQPLHVGNGRDRGGNDVRVTWFGEPTNLHRVWDSHLIDHQQLAFTEWVRWLGARIDARALHDWSERDPLAWIAESAAMRPNLYPDDDALAWSYGHRHLPLLRERLSQAGVRIAVWLNDVLGRGQP